MFYWPSNLDAGDISSRGNSSPSEKSVTRLFAARLGSEIFYRGNMSEKEKNYIIRSIASEWRAMISTKQDSFFI